MREATSRGNHNHPLRIDTTAAQHIVEMVRDRAIGCALVGTAARMVMYEPDARRTGRVSGSASDDARIGSGFTRVTFEQLCNAQDIAGVVRHHREHGFLRLAAQRRDRMRDLGRVGNAGQSAGEGSGLDVLDARAERLKRGHVLGLRGASGEKDFCLITG
jgi:hypothetical protein